MAVAVLAARSALALVAALVTTGLSATRPVLLAT